MRRASAWLLLSAAGGVLGAAGAALQDNALAAAWAASYALALAAWAARDWRRR